MFNMDPTKELVAFLVRHGELTNMHVWDAWTDIGLSDKGREQAERAAQWLSFERIGRVISSDLPRTINTAQYLMDTGAVMCPFMACDPNLRPWFLGDEFTGKEKTPERMASFQKYLDNPDLVIPGAESRNQLHERIQVIFQYIATPYKGLPTAFFVHNSVIKSLMGLDNVKQACEPGGIVGVFMDPKGDVSFEVLLGAVETEKGVS